ncbi:hypothetical protein D9V37_08560 [Nocardioides mangrovicus]|uniref:DUF4097 domain-containing protein n=1 Tax=Nocardioides mangrovicus TaxID=2478913 RepID=A0A3L8P3G7_9ACTN|nr:DUF4097 family beta strand repeat-containing protein [Nocardioides mangrovicus]RLV49920.1 hypothetical protein D9V37_08560 [Nocardioides mangrovicus]
MHTFHTPAPVALRVRTGSGLVDVRASETSETTVHLKGLNEAGQEAAEQARVEHDGHTVLVDVPRRQGFLRRGPEVQIEITVPTASSAHLQAESADIRATGSYADVTCATGSGDVGVDDVAGEAQLTAGSGDLSVGAVRGRLEVRTGSGDVAVDEVLAAEGRITSGSGDISLGRMAGRLTVKTGSGDLEVGVLEGSLEAKSGSGDLIVRRARSGRLRSTGASQDVRIGVEQGTAAWLDVSSLSGRVSQELGDTEAPAEGQPTVEISLTTVSGDLRIHRA